MDGLGDIWTLFIDGDNDDSSFVIHANVDGVVANLFDSLSCNLFEVDFSLGAYLAEYHADAIFDGTFTGYFRFGVLGETGIED
jgi:hypothetical protein